MCSPHCALLHPLGDWQPCHQLLQPGPRRQPRCFLLPGPPASNQSPNPVQPTHQLALIPSAAALGRSLHSPAPRHISPLLLALTAYLLIFSTRVIFPQCQSAWAPLLEILIAPITQVLGLDSPGWMPRPFSSHYLSLPHFSAAQHFLQILNKMFCSSPELLHALCPPLPAYSFPFSASAVNTWPPLDPC